MDDTVEEEVPAKQYIEVHVPAPARPNPWHWWEYVEESMQRHPKRWLAALLGA